MNMMDYEKIGEISVAKILRDFIGDEVLPGTDIDAGQFWSGLAGLVGEFAPRIRGQLRCCDELQGKIDAYLRLTATRPFDPASYHDFLREIGYLVPEPPNLTVRTENVLEIARVAGPQLVVPASNARYALNAANARWGSLYDALYGTDAIPETDGAARGRATIKSVAPRSSIGLAHFSTTWFLRGRQPQGGHRLQGHGRRTYCDA